MPGKYYGGKKKEKNREAFSKPPVGQAVPGKLSQADTKTSSGGSSQAFPSRPDTPFVNLGDGKTGTKVTPTGFEITANNPGLQSQIDQAKLQLASENSTQSSALNTGSASSSSGNNPFLGAEGTGDFLKTLNPTVPGPEINNNSDSVGDKVIGLLKDNPISRFFRLDDGRQTAALAVLGLRGASGLLPKAGQLAKPISGAVRSTTVKTSELVSGMFGKTVKTSVPSALGVAKYVLTGLVGVVTASLGGRVLGNYIINEELGGAAMSAYTFAKSDEEAEEIKKVWDQALEYDSGVVPFKNTLNAIEKYVELSKSLQEIAVRKRENQKIASANAESAKETAKREKEQESRDYRANVDYYNSERQKFLELELEARANAKAAQLADERNAYEKAALFWAKQKEEQRRLEAEDRIAIAKFWQDYHKLSQKIQDESRPSKLGFGLLR